MATDDGVDDQVRERSLARRLSVIVPGIVLLGLLVYGTFTRAEPEPVAGRSVPEFELSLLGGGTMSDGDLTGKPVVMNFWASWCTPCREEAPMLQALWEEHQDDVLFLGVNTKDNKLGAADFVEEFDITYPVVLDPNETLAGKLDVFGLPQTFFIDHEGHFLGRPDIEEVGEQGDTVVLGAISERVLEQKIDELIERAESE